MLNFSSVDATIIVALFTGVVSLLVSIIGIRANRHVNNSVVFKNMQETIEGLHRDIKEQDKRIGSLSRLVTSEQEKRRLAESQLLAERQKLLISTVYLRSVGHWMEQLCQVLDPQWLQEHPKPNLPDSIRPEIEAIAKGTSLEVHKSKIK